MWMAFLFPPVTKAGVGFFFALRRRTWSTMSSAFRVEASASAEAKVLTLARIPAGSRAGQGLVATRRTRETRRIRLAKEHLDAEALGSHGLQQESKNSKIVDKLSEP